MSARLLTHTHTHAGTMAGHGGGGGLSAQAGNSVQRACFAYMLRLLAGYPGLMRMPKGDITSILDIFDAAAFMASKGQAPVTKEYFQGWDARGQSAGAPRGRQGAMLTRVCPTPGVWRATCAGSAV